MSATFYLHEDSWGMVELLPAENMAEREAAAKEAKQLGEDRFTGVGWTDVYIIPEARPSIAERHIPLPDLRTLVASWLPEADTVQSGYSTYVETLQYTFAFGNTASRAGVFYGTYEGSTITHLNVIGPDEEVQAKVTRFAEALCALAQLYNLILVDWWSDTIVDLRDPAAVTSYLRRDAARQEDPDPTA
jgi:hypothetical protein